MKLHDIKLTDFTNLTEGQKMMILRWRNDGNIRKWMYGSDIISLNEHLNFINHLKRNKDKKYFLVSKNLEDIGVVYFTNIQKDVAYFGLYANPESKIPGIGRILESVSIDYAFNILKVDRLKLEVLDDNKQVINLHKKYGFQETNKKIVNEKMVICMELKNENR